MKTHGYIFILLYLVINTLVNFAILLAIDPGRRRFFETDIAAPMVPLILLILVGIITVIITRKYVLPVFIVLNFLVSILIWTRDYYMDITKTMSIDYADASYFLFFSCYPVSIFLYERFGHFQKYFYLNGGMIVICFKAVITVLSFLVYLMVPFFILLWRRWTTANPSSSK